MKHLLTVFLLFATVALTAQQTKVYNDPNAKVRIIRGAFTKISVSSGVRLYITQSNEVSLATSVSEEKFDERFKTEVEDGVLKIYFDNKGLGMGWDKNRKLTAWLSVKDLEAIKGSAGCMVTLTNELDVKNMNMSFTSGSQITGALKAASLDASATSGASIDISGSAGKTNFSANSGASIKGFELESQYCTAFANSGAEIKVRVQKEIQASANSGGSVAYEGEAVLNKGKVNSGGSVKKAH
jgi:hypothetical protein